MRRQLNFKIDEADHQRFTARVNEDGVSMQSVLETLVQSYNSKLLQIRPQPSRFELITGKRIDKNGAVIE